jgi:CBS domain-containing protein
MTTGLATIHPLDTIDHAARELHDRKIGCLPVVADGGLVGIITSSDMMRILVELVGARDRGSWVEVEVPNEPGQLANVTDVIREKKVNIGGVFLTPAHRASNRLIVLRLDTTNPSGIVKAFETAATTLRRWRPPRTRSRRWKRASRPVSCLRFSSRRSSAGDVGGIVCPPKSRAGFNPARAPQPRLPSPLHPTNNPFTPGFGCPSLSR